MGGRYFLTGVQLGMLNAFTELLKDDINDERKFLLVLKIEKILNQINDMQYLCSANKLDEFLKTITSK